MSTLGLENGSKKTAIVVGPSFDHPPWRRSRAHGGTVGGPLSIGDCVCMCVIVCGVVRTGLQVLSLLMEEGRFTFGVVAGF